MMLRPDPNRCPPPRPAPCHAVPCGAIGEPARPKPECCLPRPGCGGMAPARPTGGFLLPRILASGKEWKRRWQVCIHVEGLPATATGPYTLMAVTPSGEGCLWEIVPQPVYSRMLLHVTVPLLCQVRDGRGCIHAGRAALELDVCLHSGINGCDWWRAALMLLPSARLVCLPCASEGLCFDALVEVLVEAYLVRWEPWYSCGQKPVCAAELPLYPQPRVE